ncbi:uncharacterized protein [Gossypium hirsutum]|uniref:RNA-directed DNA polymerase homolog n=1 Tax=Gossypium hirsutum TaxID=3635 RepID=A0ABM2YVC9_GOSHI|nr:uncharacterized protein LOC121207973 [Gossypium hirsutum]
MEFDGEVVKYDVYKAMKYPDSIASLNFVDIIDPLADDSIETDLFYDFCRELEDLNDESEIISALSSISDSRLIPFKPLPLILQVPQLELKQLPSHLKYEFLGDNRTLPIIISSELSRQEEEELIAILRTYKKAIGWTLVDIQGLSPSTCMHKIKTEENAKPTREGQRRLNSPMMEVVKEEIQKLLDADIIYPISDSKWVSPVHVVPKNTGIIMVENVEGEMIPKRVSVTPEDQEKTTFTCPFGTFAYRRMPFGLCNPLATFQRCILSIFSDYIKRGIEVFMDDFTVYGFYRQFIKDFSKLAQPLYRLLRKDVNFIFDQSCKDSFDELKGRLISAPIVQPPNWTLPFEIMCDASDLSVGAVLG